MELQRQTLAGAPEVGCNLWGSGGVKRERCAYYGIIVQVGRRIFMSKAYFGLGLVLGCYFCISRVRNRKSLVSMWVVCVSTYFVGKHQINCADTALYIGTYYITYSLDPRQEYIMSPSSLADAFRPFCSSCTPSLMSSRRSSLFSVV